MTFSSSDGILLKTYTPVQEEYPGSGSSPMDIPQGAYRKTLLQAVRCVGLIYLVALTVLWTPCLLFEGKPLFHEEKAGSSYADQAYEQFPDLESELEGNRRVVSWLGQSFTYPQPLNVQDFVVVACNGAASPPPRLDLVGIPWVLGFYEVSATDLARRATAGCELETEERRIVQKVIASSVGHYRDGLWTRRLLRGVSGWIQALTLISAGWGILLLRLRYRWAHLQQRVIRSGSLPAASDASVWNLDAVQRDGVLLSERRSRGLILLPVRLILDVVFDKVEDPSLPTRAIVRARVASYRKIIDAGEYETIHFLRWITPTLGFLGTILGIISAMEAAPLIVQQVDPTAQADAIRQVSVGLGTAFDTTFLALLLSIPMTFLFFQTRKLEMSTLSVLEDTASTALSRYLDKMSDAA